MAVVFRVLCRSTRDERGEWVLSKLPIRIGRNALNDCQITDRYVSDFHAVIELVDQALYVRDLHSRNGVFAPSGVRLDASVPLRLTAPDHAFSLGQFYQIRVEVFDQHAPMGTRPSAAHGSVLGNPQMLEPGPNIPSAIHVGGRGGSGGPGLGPGPDAPYNVVPLPPLSVALRPPHLVSEPPRPSWAEPSPHGPFEGSLPGLPPLQPPGRTPSAAPGYAPANEGREVASKDTRHFSMTTETLATLGLRELAAALLPDVPLQTTGDIARLLTKLHDTVAMFCRCFVPLREGYAQFVSQMDLDRAASQRSLNRSASAMRVETAKDPAALASALIDWRNQDFDAPAVVEGIFADLMIHQIALVDGVMRGVHALLEELSPAKIELVLNEQRSSVMVLGRYRALWKTFQARYEELSDATRSFEVVFGADFASSYRDHLSRPPSQ